MKSLICPMGAAHFRPYHTAESAATAAEAAATLAIGKVVQPTAGARTRVVVEKWDDAFFGVDHFVAARPVDVSNFSFHYSNFHNF